MSRKLDTVETFTNTVGGFVLSYFASWLLFPLVGVETTAKSAGAVTFLMFVISTARLYTFRRMFRWIEGRME